jgi:hypothetical protein
LLKGGGEAGSAGILDRGGHGIFAVSMKMALLTSLNLHVLLDMTLPHF